MLFFNKKNIFCVIFLFVLVLPSIAAEYEKPNKVEVVFSPNITFDSISNSFVYNYTAISSFNSQQEVWGLSLLTNVDCSNILSPQGWEYFEVTNEKYPKMLDWAAIGGGDYIPQHSNVEPSPFQLKPGGALGGFCFETQYLPGFTTFYAEGFTKLPEFSEGMAEDFPKDYNRLNDLFQGNTVGPISVADITPLGLIQRLIILKDETPNYGWIKNQGIINSLNVKLRNAKESIIKEKNKTAINQLLAFINELDAQKDKQIDKNAWTLLKANAEFLISKLR
jgi:hypothetical protein